MIEAMACGTPVLAFRCGSVPEIIEDGVSGFMVDTMEEAIAALPLVMALDRRKVRQRFEQRFSATRMAKDYSAVYRSLIEASRAGGSLNKDVASPLPERVEASIPRQHIAQN
jgi:glycosyltransferase involved in cell wall biosynthesis